jgi:hypothetical protein
MKWQAMALLGLYHGVNPGMGWLFAVALGLQQGGERGVWRALPPIAVGHAASVAVVLLVAGLAQRVVPLDVWRFVVASVLIGLGFYRLRRHGHPRFGGMRVGFRDLTVWSFLMASAHGAGVMVLPFVMPSSATLSAAAHVHAHAPAGGATLATAGAIATAVHTLAYFTAMTLIAWVVYRRFGLSLLRTAWFNLDWIWAGALVVTGVIVFLS